MIRIGLFGIYGLYNYGCEAIVRGTVNIIQQIYDEVEIFYFSFNYEYDSERLKDLNINIIKINIRRNIARRLLNRMLYSLYIEKRLICFDYKYLSSMVDEVWSIGGDIYTIPKANRKNDKYHYFNETVEFCNYCIQMGKRVVLFGASVGPFGDYKKAVSYYIDNLQKYSLIVCREYESIKYLEDNDIENVVFCPDPAFSLKKDIKTKKTSSYIGVNLSPLSFMELFGGGCYERAVNEATRFISNLKLMVDADILLIPHVVSSDINDDDVRFLQAVFDNLDSDMKGHVHMADYDKGFFGIKEQLLSCKYVISARMHCAVNAICENVPCIFLSYSQKSIGMCEYVYGDYNWVVSIDRSQDELLKKIKEVERKYCDVRESLIKRNKSIGRELDEAIEELKSLLNN